MSFILLIQVVKKTAQSKMKENFSELFRSLKPDGGEVEEADMRRLNYCDFIDPAEDDKFYRENTDITEHAQTQDISRGQHGHYGTSPLTHGMSE